MARLISLILVACLPMLMAAGAATGAEGSPSVGAKGMPGAKGTFVFPPPDRIPDTEETTWWIDTDGIAPGIPGCHIGTDEKGKPNGRKFGEACLDSGLLVESNPGAYAVHDHKQDLGHPDTFNCEEWCIGTGATGGSCVPLKDPSIAPPCIETARCVCR